MKRFLYNSKGENYENTNKHSGGLDISYGIVKPANSINIEVEHGLNKIPSRAIFVLINGNISSDQHTSILGLLGCSLTSSYYGDVKTLSLRDHRSSQSNYLSTGGYNERGTVTADDKFLKFNTDGYLYPYGTYLWIALA